MATNENDITTNIGYKTVIKAEIKTTSKNYAVKCVFGKLLQSARDTSIDFSIHTYSQSPYRNRRDPYEVAWSSHFYQYKREHKAQDTMLG